ncbi:hypothetical protein ABH920_003056 [Catenulispora sp. EB89]|uniref:preATP grasp domain-containing protein n=1 Tax=Catenulispora sp. EB89 TaxID=3156257 RepID=UPI003510EADF
MKLLIANAVDSALWLGRDARDWSQRVFWFADDGDLVVVSDTPDASFVRHVAAVKFIDSDRIAVVTCPPGPRGNRVIQVESLTHSSFIADMSPHAERITEVFSLFPSALVSECAAVLGLTDRTPGAAFFAQGGTEMANSKAVFRALAAAADVVIAPGFVCHTEADAARALSSITESGHCAMVKRAHSGAGFGNEMVLRPGSSSPANIGARHEYRLSDTPDAVRTYWRSRWSWASSESRFPVIVEELQSVQTTMYVEVQVTDEACAIVGTGVLSYEEGGIVCETLGNPGLADPALDQASGSALRLAEIYRSIGYRGLLSLDGIVTDSGKVMSTEVNARTTSGSHLHHLIERGVVPAHTTVRQRRAEPGWDIRSTEHFLEGLAKAGITFDPTIGLGVFLVSPVAPVVGSDSFLYCTVSSGSDADYVSTLNDLFLPRV